MYVHDKPEKPAGIGKSSNGKKNKALTVVSDDFEESDSFAFMAYVRDC
jgi:hypothetical protein